MLSLLRAAPSVGYGARIGPLKPLQGLLVRHYHPKGNENEEDDVETPSTKPKFGDNNRRSFGDRPPRSGGFNPKFGDRKFDGNRGGREGGREGGFRRDGGGFRKEGGGFQREGREGREGGGFQREGREGGRFNRGEGGNFQRSGGNFQRSGGNFAENSGRKFEPRRSYNPDAKSGKFSEDRFAPQARRQFDSEEKPGKKLDNWSGSKDGAPDLTAEQKKAMAEQKATEVTVHGFHACMAIFHRRPESIVKVFITEENLAPFAEALKFLAEKKVGYSIVDKAQIEKVASAEHHEGVAFVVKKKELISVDEAIQNGTVSKLGTKDLTQPCLLFLDNLKNPHNLGSLVRAAAFFGVQTIFSYNAQDQPQLSNPLTPAAYRTAQGGAESVDIAAINNEEQAISVIKKLKQKGCKIITTSSHFTENTTSIYSPKASEVFLPTHPVVLLVGNERDGVSPALAAQADASIRIPSTGWVESLNVVQAAAVIFGELWRARGGSLASHEVPSNLQKDLETAREKWRNKPKIDKPFGTKRESASDRDYNAAIESETKRLAQELVQNRDKKREARLQFAQERTQENRAKALGKEKGKDERHKEKQKQKEEEEEEEEEEEGEEGEEEAGIEIIEIEEGEVKQEKHGKEDKEHHKKHDKQDKQDKHEKQDKHDKKQDKDKLQNEKVEKDKEGKVEKPEEKQRQPEVVLKVKEEIQVKEVEKGKSHENDKKLKEKEKTDKEKVEKERAEKEKADKQKIEKEKADKLKLDKAKAEKEKADKAEKGKPAEAKEKEKKGDKGKESKPDTKEKDKSNSKKK